MHTRKIRDALHDRAVAARDLTHLKQKHSGHPNSTAFDPTPELRSFEDNESLPFWKHEHLTAGPACGGHAPKREQRHTLCRPLKMQGCQTTCCSAPQGPRSIRSAGAEPTSACLPGWTACAVGAHAGRTSTLLHQISGHMGSTQKQTQTKLHPVCLFGTHEHQSIKTQGTKLWCVSPQGARTASAGPSGGYAPNHKAVHDTSRTSALCCVRPQGA